MKPKLLVLTPRFPYPVIGGDRLRIYQICKVLSTHFDLTLLSLTDSKKDIGFKTLDNIFVAVEVVYMPKWKSWLNCILALPSKIPLQVAYYKNRKFKDRAKDLMSWHDGALAHLIRVGDAIKDIEAVKFLEMTDAISLNYSRVRDAEYLKPNFLSFIYSLEASRLRMYETTIVDNFNLSILVSEIDRQYLFGDLGAAGKRVIVSTNGVDLDDFKYSYSEDAVDLIFIGNMQSLQNYDAAYYMASEVLPIVRKYLPHVKLRLIGRISTKDADKLSAFDGVYLTGEVANVSIAAHGGAIGVCPVRLGAGVQNKVLEYMALGLPVVSTSIGLQGFDAVNGEHLIVADDADEFAKEILILLNDKNKRKHIAAAARAYVECNHAWKSKFQPVIENIIKELDK